MADITAYPLLHHLRSAPTAHIRHVRRGAVVHEGAGASFWFRPLTAVLSEVPVDDRELPLHCHARTADFQAITVQATITFRITDPDLAARRVDFSLDPRSGQWRGRPLEQLGGLLVETAQQHALDLLVRLTLTAALADGVTAVRERMATGLAADPRLAETGIAVIGVRVVAVRPEPEVEQALQTPAREQVQQEADKATFSRRALAVERVRAIAENEMQNQIELARREEALVAQRGANARRQAEEAAAAGRVEVEAEAARQLRLGEVQALATRALGEARAAAKTARVAAYRNLGDGTLLALAMKDLATNLPKIDTLVLSPDLLAPVLARVAGGSA